MRFPMMMWRRTVDRKLCLDSENLRRIVLMLWYRDQCGAVYDSNPKLLTISVGGNNAYVTPGAPGAPVQ
jgi:hypothetical protein